MEYPFEVSDEIDLLKSHTRVRGIRWYTGVLADRSQTWYYPLLVREVTAERVKKHFAGICKGEVERFELPNLNALNFLLHEHRRRRNGLKTDPQGKDLELGLAQDGNLKQLDN